MKGDPFKQHRRSIRLRGYDYSQQGAYYITLVTQTRKSLFGEIADGEMRLNEAGQMIQLTWNELPQRFPNVKLDEFVVMPTHIRAIIVITDKMNPDDERAGIKPAPTNAIREQMLDVGATLVVAPDVRDPNKDSHDPTLGNIIGAWKSIVTDKYIRGVHQSKWEPFHRRLWQRGYYDHIIRDEQDLNRIREYIVNNPLRWETDEENPKNISTIRC